MKHSEHSEHTRRTFSVRRCLRTARDIRDYLLLWLTQTLSSLGSGMTSYALVIWSYTQEGSALMTALLAVSSYAPYVLCSVFAGALSDRWDKRRTMLVCDTVAAMTTVATLILLRTGQLRVGHLYLINAVNGLMNTVQQPASEVATSILLPKRYYQRMSGLRALSGALTGILQPILATAILGMLGMDALIYFDLGTFAVAFLTLLLFIRLPKAEQSGKRREPLMASVREGLRWLWKHQGILHLILFLAAINLVASMYSAAFPAMMLSREGGSQTVLGTVNAVIGAANLVGSLLAVLLPAPRSRVRVICWTLFASMCTENFFLAFGRDVWVWAIGGFLGWVFIPVMNTNLNTIMRLNIPLDIQGRVYAVRNSLQFFTIPLGNLLGGALVDGVFESLMAEQPADGLLAALFGLGKGSGAALFFAALWLCGIAVCVIFRFDRHIWDVERRAEGEGGAAC